MAKVVKCPICNSRNISYIGESETVYCNNNGGYPMWCKGCDYLWYSKKNPSDTGIACPKCREMGTWNRHDDVRGVTQFFKNWATWTGAGTE